MLPQIRKPKDPQFFLQEKGPWINQSCASIENEIDFLKRINNKCKRR